MPSPYPIPLNETQRLRVLDEYQIVDTPPEAEFDRLVALAARLFNVPIVLVSLIDRDRQVFKARVGLDACETSREIAFCAHAILHDDILFVPDATQDPRFAHNSLVLGVPFIRFYAGKPLITPSGERLGTLCLIDSKPRTELSAEDRQNLTDLAALVMDRLELRRLHHVRNANQARFENIAATSPDAIICTDAKGFATFWNHAAQRLFGYSAAEMLGQDCVRLVPGSWRSLYDREIELLRQGLTPNLAQRTVTLSGRRQDGSEFPAEFSFSVWPEGKALSAGAIVRDITERRQNEERLFRLASLDPLTELPNRGMWRQCLEAALAAEQPLTVLLLDLDGFKDVNDSLGHSAGDHVLREAAHRIKHTCDTAIMVARLGGDEFVVLLAGNDRHQASGLAAHLIAAIGQPFSAAGRRHDIGVSIGIAFSPEHSTRPDELLGAADLALYRAKAAGKGRWVCFELAMREVALARRAFEQELRLAFERGEFELYYQPQLSAVDRRLIGAEALIRWNHPDRGLLTPASFIEVLSRKPSAAAVGEWIMQTACRQAAEWRTQVPQLRMGVNLFEAQFRSGRLLTSVREALALAQLPPEALELEIVENVLLRHDGITLKLLKDLRLMGVSLAFDDYGTGFASLSLLKRYPVNRLKIDRSFVNEVTANPEDAAVVRAVLYLGRSFGMEVTAEGVETEEQLTFLRHHHCSEVQGYLFSPPIPAAAFAAQFVPGAAAGGPQRVLPAAQ